MTQRDGLRQDVAHRVANLQKVMREKGIGATLITATAGPGLFGVAKYFTNLVMWYGHAYVVIGCDHPEPVLVHWSNYQSKWNRQEAVGVRVETPDASIALQSLNAFVVAADIARDMAGSSRRIGVERMYETWLGGEVLYAREHMSDWEYVDIAQEIDGLRSIKSGFEIEEIRNMGGIIAGSFDRFAEVARPGKPIWEAMAAAEEVVKAKGCQWGRAKLSLDRQGPTIPPPVDRRFVADDVVVLELDYPSPLGYWYEMTGLFSFKPLPSDCQKLLNATGQAINAAVDVLRPGTPIGHVTEVIDDTFRGHGYRPLGKHIPDCHSFGLDENDGPNAGATPQALLQENMTVALHPGTRFEDQQAFLLSDSFLVAADGAVRLSPRNWLHKLIE